MDGAPGMAGKKERRPLLKSFTITSSGAPIYQAIPNMNTATSIMVDMTETPMTRASLADAARSSRMAVCFAGDGTVGKTLSTYCSI